MLNTAVKWGSADDVSLDARRNTPCAWCVFADVAGLLVMLFWAGLSGQLFDSWQTDISQTAAGPGDCCAEFLLLRNC